MGCAAPRNLVARDTPAPPPNLPLAGSLGQAFVASQAALVGAESIFASAANGERVPTGLAEETVRQLLAALDDDADAIVSLIRLKAPGDFACMHSVAVSTLMALLGRHLGFDARQLHEAAMAGLLHDIGKAFVPSRVLAKPGPLTAPEFDIVRAHSQHGYIALCANADISDAVRDVAYHHHERPDGKGYPHGLPGYRITLLASMSAVCDVYEAITSERPYKDGWDPAGAVQSMTHWAQGGQFDVKLMAAFRTVMGTYPIGSLVRLRSERLAVVNARLRGKGSGVAVTAFYCLRSQRPMPSEVVEVAGPDAADPIVAIESNTVWRFRDLDRLWAGPIADRARGMLDSYGPQSSSA